MLTVLILFTVRMRTITKFWRQLRDLLSPRACVVCGRRLPVATEVLCPLCQLHLPRTGFQQSPDDNLLARLFWGIIPVERAVALCYYSPASGTARAIYDMKYHHRPDVGIALGRLMATELQPSGFFEDIDLLVPVPLAPNRLRERGYNQSLQLALGVSRVTGLPVSEDVVCRTAFTRSQTQLIRQNRQENVEGVFKLCQAEKLSGRHVLLIDDVITTGATITACARELLRAKNVRVSILAFGLTHS
jgi:ComF family protein